MLYWGFISWVVVRGVHTPKKSVKRIFYFNGNFQVIFGQMFYPLLKYENCEHLFGTFRLCRPFEVSCFRRKKSVYCMSILTSVQPRMVSNGLLIHTNAQQQRFIETVLKHIPWRYSQPFQIGSTWRDVVWSSPIQDKGISQFSNSDRQIGVNFEAKKSPLRAPISHPTLWPQNLSCVRTYRIREQEVRCKRRWCPGDASGWHQAVSLCRHLWARPLKLTLHTFWSTDRNTCRCGSLLLCFGMPKQRVLIGRTQRGR